MSAAGQPSLYASPADAQRTPAEDLLYVRACTREPGCEHPTSSPSSMRTTAALCTRRRCRTSATSCTAHFGWNRCSSACHGPDRSHLVMPGFRSSRVHVLDVSDPRKPAIEKVIEPDELLRETGYTRPHTVHCMPGGNVVLSMLGDADGNGAGGFACLDAETFAVKGRWENGGERPGLNYDFWYQPRADVLVSSEFGEPNAYEPGFDLEDVGSGRYGQRLHFWNLSTRELEQTIDLGERGLVPLELRMRHDPDATEGFAAATLSSVVWRFHRPNGSWAAAPVIETEAAELDGWPIPVDDPNINIQPRKPGDHWILRCIHDENPDFQMGNYDSLLCELLEIELSGHIEAG